MADVVNDDDDDDVSVVMFDVVIGVRGVSLTGAVPDRRVSVNHDAVVIVLSTFSFLSRPTAGLSFCIFLFSSYLKPM